MSTGVVIFAIVLVIIGVSLILGGLSWYIIKILYKGYSAVVPPKPSKYPGGITTFPSLCLSSGGCGTLASGSDGVGWVLNNKSSKSLGVYLATGSNCDTRTPSCDPVSILTTPLAPGTFTKWSEIENPTVMIPSAIVLIGSSLATSVRTSVPPDLNPAKEFVVFTVKDAGKNIVVSTTTQSY
ncbi:hypothetical protein KDA11_05005 [Candidatus Saccharibacteria bacterium]|nr:hypothetical protein [Candidatus Saccharibacteria bacterium]